MAEIVNLRMARKRKARDEREREADRNRIVHGRSKAERQRLEAEQGRAERFVEGHRRQSSPAPASSPLPTADVSLPPLPRDDEAT